MTNLPTHVACVTPKLISPCSAVGRNVINRLMLCMCVGWLLTVKQRKDEAASSHCPHTAWAGETASQDIRQYIWASGSGDASCEGWCCPECFQPSQGISSPSAGLCTAFCITRMRTDKRVYRCCATPLLYAMVAACAIHQHCCPCFWDHTCTRLTALWFD